MGRGKEGPGLVRAKSDCAHWGAVPHPGICGPHSSQHQGQALIPCTKQWDWSLKAASHRLSRQHQQPPTTTCPSPKQAEAFHVWFQSWTWGVPQAESRLQKNCKKTAAVSENEICQYWKCGDICWPLETQRCDQTQHNAQIPLHEIINIFLGSELSQQIAVKASRDLKTRTERCRGVCCSSSWTCEAFTDWNDGYATSLT